MTVEFPPGFDPLKEVAAARASADAEGARQRRYEERTVRALLKRFMVEDMAIGLKRKCRQATGDYRLAWSFVYQELTGLPIRLCSRKLPYVYKVTHVDMYRRFTKAPFFEAFVEAREQLQHDGAIGLVFDWPAPEGEERTGLGDMVIHDMELCHDSTHTRFTHRVVLERPISLHIERYKDLLEGLTWSPG
jgi:hypothetical protein